MLVLVGNKSDMNEKRAVTTEEGQALADELGIPFIEASAKTNDNVDQTFFSLARRVKENVLSATDNAESAAGNKNVNVGGSTNTSTKCC